MTRTTALLTLLLAALSTPARAGQTETIDGYRIEVLEACPPAVTPGAGKLVLYGGGENRLSGWSHINGANEYARMALAPARYAIGASNSKADPACAGELAFQAVLVKKYADWDRQHSNGIEPRFAASAIRFGAVDKVVIELRLDSAGTTIPTPSQLKAAYGEIVGEQNLDAWDGGQANLALTLFEDGWDEQSQPSFTAQRFIEINRQRHADRWLRITLPAASFNYFTEQNWAPTPRALADFADHTVVGLRINPETRSGKVVRHYRNPLDAGTPEMFKEMAISIRSLTLYLK